MTSRGEFAAEVALIWRASLANIQGRLDAIDAAGAALLAGSLDDERRAAAIAGAHRLAGSLGTFGLPHGSELASELETMLRAPGIPPVMRVSELAERLRAIVHAGPPATAYSAVGADVPLVDAHAVATDVGEASVDVVLVDDDTVITELLRHALLIRGYTAIVMADGRAAVEALTGPSRLRCRLLLLDVNLPGLDGLAVLRRLAAAGVTGTTPTIMLTVRASETEILEALRIGAVDHVAKPFSLPVLMERIRLALER